MTVTRAKVAAAAGPEIVALLNPAFDTLSSITQQQQLWIARRSNIASNSGTLPPAEDQSIFQWVQALWRTLTGETITSIYGVPTPTAPVIPAAPQVITAALIPTAEVLTPAPTPVAPEVSAAVNTPAAATASVLPSGALETVKQWFDGETFGIPNKFLAVGAVLGVLLFGGGAAPAMPVRRGRR